MSNRDKVYAQVFAKAWADSEFKRKLSQHPKEVLTKFGLNLPDHISLKLLENTGSIYYYVLPHASVELPGIPQRQSAFLKKIRTDEAFKRRFIQNPAKMLREEGMEIPPRAQVKVIEDSEHVWHIILPQKPKLTEEDLKNVSAAGSFFQIDQAFGGG